MGFVWGKSLHCLSEAKICAARSQSLQQFEAGAAVVVGAVLKTNFHVAEVDPPGAVGLFEPVAVNAMYQMVFDEHIERAAGYQSGVV